MPTAAPSSGRGMSSRQGENPDCPHYHRWHSFVCRRVTRGCFKCGSTNHFLANCPRESRDSRNPQGSGRGGSMTTPETHDQGRDQGVLGQHRGRGIVSETVDRPMLTAPA